MHDSTPAVASSAQEPRSEDFAVDLIVEMLMLNESHYAITMDELRPVLPYMLEGYCFRALESLHRILYQALPAEQTVNKLKTIMEFYLPRP